MADNVTLPGTGDIVHADEYTHAVYGPGKSQLVKIASGTPGAGDSAQVTPASTAAVATDPALVVTLSPNNGAKITDGTNTATVNAASTAAVATDKALVVGLSPNSPLPTGTNTLGKINGALTNNNAAPAATNFGTIPALANASAPSWTEGNQVMLSSDLAGAIRVLERHPSTVLGVYAAVMESGVYAGLASGAAYFSFRWGDATRLCALLRVNVTVIQSAPTTTAARVSRRLRIARSFSASDSGGTAATLTGNSFKLRTSYPTTLLTDMRVLSNAALTVGTRTLDTQGVGLSVAWSTLSTASTATAAASTYPTSIALPPQDLYNAGSAIMNGMAEPYIFAQNEGFIIDSADAQPAGSSLSTFVQVVWAELSAF